MNGSSKIARARQLLPALVGAAWLALSWPVLAWAGAALLEKDARLNLVLVAVFLVVCARGARREQCVGAPAEARSALAPLLVIAGAAVAYVVAERALGLHRVSALPVALGSWGVLGLVLSAGAWRSALLPSLLLVVCLPYASWLETYLGFPARVASAELARGLLAFAGWHGVGRETLLVFENGVASVDVPCSGMKSMWAGAVLALGATWLMQRRCGVRWLAATGGYALLLLAANGLRIATLAAVGVLAGQHLLAETLHVPLGLAGFAGASLAFLAVLRRLPARAPRLASPRSPATVRWATVCASALLPLLVASTAFSRTAGTWKAATAGAGPALVLPEDLAVAAVPLSATEEHFFGSRGARRVSKVRFAWRQAEGTGLRGSLLVVISDTFRAQHLPEQCYTAAGLRVSHARTAVLPDGTPVSVLGFDGHGTQAVYWFQSPRRTVADYGQRVWAELRGEGPWAQVSILFDEPLATDTPPPGIVQLLRDSIDSQLSGGKP